MLSHQLSISNGTGSLPHGKVSLVGPAYSLLFRITEMTECNIPNEASETKCSPLHP